MIREFFKHYIYPIATMSGSIIGVGFLSLPYLAVQIGIWPMMAYFAVLAFFVVCMHVMFAKVSLHTPDFKRFPGFVGYYLGTPLKTVNLVSMAIGSVGILLVYLIIGSQFLSALVAPWIGAHPMAMSIAYFIAAAGLVYYGINIVSKFEFWAIVFLLGSLCLIFFKGFDQLSLANVAALHANVHVSNWFLPYGAIVFSLWGTGLIPEIEEMLRDPRQSRHLSQGKRHLKLVVVLGTMVPVAIYLAFIFLVLSISGNQTSEAAIVGLERFLGSGVVSIALLVGIVTTFTAFITQGLLLKKVLMFDMKIPEFPAWALVCGLPMSLLLLGFTSFIPLLSFVGGVLLSVDGILILLMYQRIGGKKIVIYPLMAFFVAAAIFSII